MVKQGYFDHECDLVITADSCALELPPYLPKYKRWFFSLRKFFVVDENSSRARRFFRSHATLMAEKKRHAEGEYYRTIHPFSKFAIFMERTICIFWMMSFFFDPFRSSFFLPCDNSHFLFKMELFSDLVFLINVALTCFTGYCVPLTKEIVLSPKRIVKTKAISFLIPEILASLPYKTIQLSYFKVNPRKSRITIIFAIRFLRYLRLIDMIRYLKNIFYDLKIGESLGTVLVTFLMLFYLIHWSACFMYSVTMCYYTWDELPMNTWLIDIQEDDDKDNVHALLCSGTANRFFDTYVIVLIGTTCHFLGAGDGYRNKELLIEKVTCSFVLICGMTYCNYAVAKIFELFGSVNISESKYQELLYQVPDYVRSKNLSEELKKRLILYYEYKFQRRYFKEEEILSTLSEHLRCEVLLYTCKPILQRVPLLQGLSKGVIGSIIGYLKKEIYLPNDVVIKHGEPMTKMFWVSHGTLAVYYGPSATEILHFEDGDHFCDNAMIRKGTQCILSVVALEITEVFTLARRDVKHCTLFLKEMTERITRIGREKSKLYKSLYDMMTDEGMQNRVLADLRKGRILERESWRRKRYKKGAKRSVYDKKLK
ncbi:hypothetical protein WA026_003218 [Henosepilachna vigintioctopunctata]|uniref:Cyclic nucleotide-binding domain-containing protein n=1 Tax=Henosepilachna vigintioctopunctata TaxID=420089 RepID=A0AAW1TMB3_9CUCU